MRECFLRIVEPPSAGITFLANRRHLSPQLFLDVTESPSLDFRLRRAKLYISPEGDTQQIGAETLKFADLHWRCERRILNMGLSWSLTVIPQTRETLVSICPKFCTFKKFMLKKWTSFKGL
jgi:hypothetical protein